MDYGIFVLAAVFMIIRIVFSNQKKRKKENEQKARRLQQAYNDADVCLSYESTVTERKHKEHARVPPQNLGEGDSTWNVTPSSSHTPRIEDAYKRDEAATIATQRIDLLQRERSSLVGISELVQEGISVEGRPLNSKLNRHKLESSSITGHAHTENSLDGRTDNCDDYGRQDNDMGRQASTIPAMIQNLNFTNDDIVKGFIFGEILSKPKALRR